MVGRFDTTFAWAQPGKLIVSGVLQDCTPNARVRIEVTRLQQGNEDVHCKDDFTMPGDGSPLVWAMDVSAPFHTGTADGDATATERDNPGQTFSWSAPDPPTTGPINIP
jgi:hypothetical protein